MNSDHKNIHISVLSGDTLMKYALSYRTFFVCGKPVSTCTGTRFDSLELFLFDFYIYDNLWR